MISTNSHKTFGLLRKSIFVLIFASIQPQNTLPKDTCMCLLPRKQSDVAFQHIWTSFLSAPYMKKHPVFHTEANVGSSYPRIRLKSSLWKFSFAKHPPTRRLATCSYFNIYSRFQGSRKRRGLLATRIDNCALFDLVQNHSNLPQSGFSLMAFLSQTQMWKHYSKSVALREECLNKICESIHLVLICLICMRAQSRDLWRNWNLWCDGCRNVPGHFISVGICLSSTRPLCEIVRVWFELLK